MIATSESIIARSFAPADQKTIQKVLELLPHKPPFRFVDGVSHLSEQGIVGSYRFQEDEYFYKGHFPGRPVTPGVILVETMAQVGVAALGIFLFMQKGLSENRLKQMTTLFAVAEGIEFTGVVLPGDKVMVHGEKVYFRKGSLKTNVSMVRESGEMVCSGVLTGAGVNLDEK